MRVAVQLFSFLRDCLPGKPERGRVEVELAEGADLAVLVEALDLQRCLEGDPVREAFLTSWQVSVNGEFVLDLSRTLRDGDQVIVFPHIAGG